MWELHGELSFSKIMGLFYLFVIVPKIFYFNTTDQAKSFIWPLCFFFVILTVINIFNINSIYKNFFNFTIFQNIILFWILVNHEQQDRMVLEKAMISFALGSVVLAILFIAGVGIDYTHGRVNVFGDNQNNIGVRMSISMVILILAAIQNPLQLSKLRYLLLIPIPLMMRLMAETGSRVAFVSFVLAFILGILLVKFNSYWKKIAVFSIGILVFIFVWQYLMQSDVLRQRILLSIHEGDMSQRDLIWQKVIILIKSNPILGVGETGYFYYSEKAFGMVKSPHNVILELLCYTGIVGLFTYLVFFFRIIKRSIHHFKTDNLFLPILLLPLLTGLVFTAQILNVKIGWVIFAYISGYYSLIEDQK